jgi:DNA-binding HxlR family transcriptional regulator
VSESRYNMGMSTASDMPGVCAQFHKAVELIGGRWTGAIIQLLMKGPTRYCGIREAVPDISDRMLSERLRELEEEGIVERLVVPETPVRVEYRLTAKGKALEPAFAAIGKWAHRYLEPAPQTKPAPKNAGRERAAARR